MSIRMSACLWLAFAANAAAQPFVVNLQNVENDERTARRFERDQLAPRLANRTPLRVVANRSFHTPEEAFFEVTQTAPRIRSGVNEFDINLTITGTYRGQVLLQDTYREVGRDKQAAVERALAKFAVGIVAAYDRLHPPVMVARPPLPPPIPTVAVPELGVVAAATPAGAQLLRVDAGGAAQAAGLLPQDFIQWIDGIQISSADLLTYALSQPGRHVTLTCARGSAAGPQFSVTLHRHDGRFSVHKPVAWYKRPGERGYAVVVGQPVVLAELGATGVVEPTGVRLTSVQPGGMGFRLGLVAGDLVQSINGRPVYTADELRVALSAGAGSVHFIAGLRGTRAPVPFQARLKLVAPGRYDIDRALSLQTTIRLGGPARPVVPPVPPPPVVPPPVVPPRRVPPPPPMPPG